MDHPRESDQGEIELLESPEIIEFDNVTFKYPNSELMVLDKVSVEVRKGSTIAIVGKSGSGKSTLTSLLLRFYNVTSGKIKFDDTVLEEFTLDSLRKNIAFVSQQVVLFNGSIISNIAYGEKSPDKERVRQAAEKAHAIEFIEKMEGGFESNIGEDGSKLSGGQRQRLAIARAIYKDSPIIILDEATSALDTESERHIQAALDALTKNRTTFVIAHRLSTIENADKILVMEEGKIVESGTHQALIEQNGAYSKLHSIQFAED